MKTKSESGIALVSALLILVLLGALLVAFIVSVNSDQSLISVDRDQNRAYYGAQAGLEQLTASLGSLFDTNYAPTAAQINALTATPPVLTGISFVSPGAVRVIRFRLRWMLTGDRWPCRRRSLPAHTQVS